MIVKTTLAISAEHANLPLDTAAVFVGSAATFSITGVPTLPAISVAAVAVSVTNAVGAVSTVAAVSGEDGWTATFPASHFAAAGTVKDGVAVAISGTDENGAARTWIAGVGSIVVLSASPMPEPGDVVYNLRLHDAEPDAPTDGDVWPDGDGGYLLWQDGEAHPLGGGSSITVDDELSTTSENPVQNKVVTAALAGKLTRAEAVAGFTEWTCVPAMAQGQYAISIVQSTGESGWRPRYADGEGTGDQKGDGSSTSLSWAADEWMGGVPLTATRTRLPTMADVDAKLDKTDVVNPETATDNGKAADARITYQMLTLMDAAKENVSNKVTSLSAQSTDAQYPSAKCVYDELAGKADASALPYALVDVTVTNGTATLTDRAINAVSLTESATLAFPAQTAGKARDFVVRLTLTETNDVVPSVTFPADVAYETDGGEWPDLTEAGTYIVRLTEVPTASESETARFFLQCSSAVADATPPSAGGAA